MSIIPPLPHSLRTFTYTSSSSSSSCTASLYVSASSYNNVVVAPSRLYAYIHAHTCTRRQQTHAERRRAFRTDKRRLPRASRSRVFSLAYSLSLSLPHCCPRVRTHTHTCVQSQKREREKGRETISLSSWLNACKSECMYARVYGGGRWGFVSKGSRVK